MTKIWRKLDNTAKIFSVDQKEGNMFRLSAILKEKIDPYILKTSVVNTLENFNDYKVCLKSGFFWNYLEKNYKEPVIEEENEKPCIENVEPSERKSVKVENLAEWLDVEVGEETILLTAEKNNTIFVLRCNECNAQSRRITPKVY